MSKPDISFIGLGAMGFGMATNLVKRGYAVTGFDVWAPTLDKFAAAGGKTATTPAAASVDKPVCVCMVATAQQAQAVLIDGPDAAAAALPQGSAILLCSTVPCGYVQDLARQIADPNGPVKRPDLLLVDCPVSGGAARAADGTLSIMAGSPDAAFNAHAHAKSVLADLADPEKLYLIAGGIGAGSNTKMVHQVLAANQILSGCEGMGLAVRLGLEANETTLNTLLASPGHSWMFGHRGPRMINNFQPIASAVQIIVKDTAIITSEARRMGFIVPMTSAVENVMYDAMARGYALDDDSSILRVYTNGRENVPPAPASLTADDKIKLVIDLLKGIHLASAAECLAFAHHVNLDLDMVLGLCINAAGGSAMLEAHGPHIIAALRNGTAASGWAPAEGEETLESIYKGLEAAVVIAQQIKAPLYLGTQALTVLRMALRSSGPKASSIAAGSVVKVWLE
ncbi:3-hydroxyisobutyrate mitochondrial precursor [Ophiostoma piceae UAMH 11346]|uniref:3-hydroxyisobutyrate mitochondrial n=1 Tax=Ophiostoma piceae (strain UAMH 11346) TaxID=1262450 RepID=S3D173_OPHP1|nr:3-hydroxyisobutyrate mitochondrial precursor [Ophiostoma piceae UAMH 11346]